MIKQLEKSKVGHPLCSITLLYPTQEPNIIPDGVTAHQNVHDDDVIVSIVVIVEQFPCPEFSNQEVKVKEHFTLFEV